MKKEDLRIVYMGTPDFAVESLRALVEGGYNVVGVITMPDKPMGRHGSVLQPSAVKQYAVSVGLPVLQPEKLKDEAFLEELRDTETGVTTFFLTHEIDTGKIIRQRHLPIADTDDVETVHDALMAMGAGLVTETVDLLLDGKTDAIPQEEFYKDAAELRPAPKIFKDTCHIDWNQPVKKIYDFVRGLSPYPAAWTELISEDGKRLALKIYQAEKRPAEHNFPVGSIHTDHKSYIDVAVKDGFLRLRSLQLAGKKRMNITDFLNGFKQIAEYTVG